MPYSRMKYNGDDHDLIVCTEDAVPRDGRRAAVVPCVPGASLEFGGQLARPVEDMINTLTRLSTRQTVCPTLHLPAT